MRSVRYSAVLSKLDPRDLDVLLERSTKRVLGAEEILFIAGEPSSHIYLVLDGLLKLIASDSRGYESILGFAAEGDLLGEAAFVEDGKHAIDAIAAGRSRVLALDGQRFLRALARNPEATLELARTLARRIRWTTMTVLERSTAQVPARLAGRLLDVAELVGHMRGGTIEFELPLAQSDLGRLAGTSRESTCKTLSRFRARGLLDYKGRHFRLLRPDLLELVRCGELASEPSR